MDEQYALTDLYDSFEEQLEVNTKDMGNTLSDDEKRSIVVWAYSFWLRRTNDGTSEVSHTILEEINSMYNNL